MTVPRQQTETPRAPRAQAPSVSTSALHGFALYGVSMCHNEALIHLFTEQDHYPSRAENGGGG